MLKCFHLREVCRPNVYPEIQLHLTPRTPQRLSEIRKVWNILNFMLFFKFTISGCLNSWREKIIFTSCFIYSTWLGSILIKVVMNNFWLLKAVEDKNKMKDEEEEYFHKYWHSNSKLNCHTVTLEPSISVTYTFKILISFSIFSWQSCMRLQILISTSDFCHLHGQRLFVVTLLVPGFCHVRQIRRISGEWVGLILRWMEIRIFLFISCTLQVQGRIGQTLKRKKKVENDFWFSGLVNNLQRVVKRPKLEGHKDLVRTGHECQSDGPKKAKHSFVYIEECTLFLWSSLISEL